MPASLQVPMNALSTTIEWVVDDDAWLETCCDVAREHFNRYAPSPTRNIVRTGLEYCVPTSKLETFESLAITLYGALATNFPDRVQVTTGTHVEHKSYQTEYHVVLKISAYIDWGDADVPRFPRRRSEVEYQNKLKAYNAALIQLCAANGWKLCCGGINAHVPNKTNEQKETEKAAVKQLKTQFGL